MSGKKYEIVLSVLTIMTVLVTAVGVSFAYFTGSIEGNPGDVVISTSTIGGVTFDGGSDFVASTDIEPGWKESKTFSITVAPSVVEQTVYIKLDYTNDMPELTAKVDSVSDGAVGTLVLDSTGEKKSYTIVSKTFPASNEAQSVTYTLTMELPETGVVQNQNQGKTFSALLYADLGESDIYYNDQNPNGTTQRPTINE